MENVKMEDAFNDVVSIDTFGKNAANMKSNNKSECPQCFAEVLDLKQHIKRVHNKKPETEVLICKDCGRKCTNKNQLTLHWNYVHLVMENLFCNLCAKPCSNILKLRQHTVVCIAKIKKMKDIEDKQGEHIALESQFRESEVTKVLPEKCAKKFSCNLCKKSCSNLPKLKRHTKRCLPMYLEGDSNQQRENETTKSKVNKSDEYLHNKEQNLNCPECGKPCSGIISLTKHRRICISKEYIKVEEVNEEPVDEDKKLPSEEKNEPACDLIVKDEVSDYGFTTDDLEARQDTSSWQDDSDISDDGNQSNYKQAKPEPVEKHFNGDSTKHVACHLCQKILANKKYMKSHMLRKHSEETRVVCEYCAKDYKSTNIKNHIKEMHFDLIESKCPKCDKIFPRKKAMNDHMRELHAEEKGVCEICCKTFENRTYLQRHIRTVHNTSDLLYPCQHCSKQYKSTLHLRNHIKIVHTVNNVECGICRKVYKNKLLLGKHHRKYHRT